MTKALHLSLSAERYTPEYVVSPARDIFGGFDLDPASCKKANSVIKASSYYTEKDDGLVQLWEAESMVVNPPGTCKTYVGEFDEDDKPVPHFLRCGNLLKTRDKNGDLKRRKTCSCNYVQRFWDRLIDHVDSGKVTRALWIGFNPSQLQTLQQCWANPLDFYTCFPSARVRYLGPDLEPLPAPPHNSYLTLVCRPGDPVERLFREAYSNLGAVVKRA